MGDGDGVFEANRAKLTLLATRLLIEETMEGPEFQELHAGAMDD